MTILTVLTVIVSIVIEYPLYLYAIFTYNYIVIEYNNYTQGLLRVLGPHYTNPARRAPLKDFVLSSLVVLATKNNYRSFNCYESTLRKLYFIFYSY